MAGKVYEFDRLTEEQKEEIRVELGRTKGKALFVVHPSFAEAYVRAFPLLGQSEYDQYWSNLERLIRQHNCPVFVMLEHTPKMDRVAQRMVGKIPGMAIIVYTGDANPRPILRGLKNKPPEAMSIAAAAEKFGKELGIRRAIISGEVRRPTSGNELGRHRGCVVELNSLLRAPFLVGHKITIRKGVRTTRPVQRTIQTEYRLRATFPFDERFIRARRRGTR